MAVSYYCIQVTGAGLNTGQSVVAVFSCTVFARAPVILNPIKFTVELGIKHHCVLCILDDLLDPTALTFEFRLRREDICCPTEATLELLVLVFWAVLRFGMEHCLGSPGEKIIRGGLSSRAGP
jgi:hypothetical protein